MEKITIKNLIDFRRKTERTRKTFVNNLKKEKSLDDDSGGGDYWISCLSAISNTFKYDNSSLLNEKIELLLEKKKLTDDRRIKNLFQRNIDILSNFEDFDFQQIKPDAELNFHKKPKFKSILDIKGFPVEAKPHHVFSFSNSSSEEIGAVWFIAKLGGYKKSELAMFTDIIYRYLSERFSKDFYVNPNYCIAIDVSNGLEVNYTQIQNGEVPILIDSTLEEIKKL